MTGIEKTKVDYEADGFCLPEHAEGETFSHVGPLGLENTVITAERLRELEPDAIIIVTDEDGRRARGPPPAARSRRTRRRTRTRRRASRAPLPERSWSRTWTRSATTGSRSTGTMAGG